MLPCTMKIEKTDSLAYLLNLDETWAKNLKPTDVIVVYALQGRLAELEDQVEQVKVLIKAKLAKKFDKDDLRDADEDAVYEAPLASRWKDEPKKASNYNMDKMVVDDDLPRKSFARTSRKMVADEESIHD